MTLESLAEGLGRCVWVLVAALSVGGAVSMAGCRTASPWVQVRSQMVGQSGQPEPEVVATPQYQAAVATIRSVALKAPDYCANKSAAETEGQARATGTVLSTRCGIEMGELERALAMVGYQVTSWSTLANAVNSENVTPSAAAARLGAQVLFQVNSLQKVRLQPQIDYRWDRGVWELDQRGQAPTGRAPQLSQVDYGILFQEADRREAAARPREVLGAALDVNAIMVSTGQSIWFYRGTRLEQIRDQELIDFRAMRGQQGWQFYESATQPQPAAPPSPTPAAVVTRSVSGAPASPEDQAYYRLMLELVRDFAWRFSAKQPSPAAAPAPAAPAAPPAAPAPAAPTAPPAAPPAAPPPAG